MKNSIIRKVTPTSLFILSFFLGVILCIPNTTYAQLFTGNTLRFSGWTGNIGIGDNSNSVNKLYVKAHSGMNASAAIYGQGATGANASGIEGFAQNGAGVYGRSNQGYGIYGHSSSGYAGYFSGKVYVSSVAWVNDKIGIGQASPDAPFHIKHKHTGSGSNVMIKLENSYKNGGENSPAISFHNGKSGSNEIYWLMSGKVEGSPFFDISRHYANSSKLLLRLDEKGNLGLGTNDFSESGYNLFIKGGVKTGKVKTDASLADYVFEETYHLISLDSLEAFVETHHHLPGVISQQEVDQQNGLELTSFSVQLQEKIEELFLHVIAMDKRMQSLETSIKQLSKNNHE